jgi:CheY-like chemotaxis protein
MAERDGQGLGSTGGIGLSGVAALDAHPLADGSLQLRSQPAAVEGRLLSILLVEDHVDTARIVARLLRGLGHRVRVANGVADAVGALDASAFDVLLSDIGLPDGSGLDVVRHLRAHHDIPAIAMTGHGGDDDVASFRAAGFTDHLIKPVTFQRLRLAIIAGDRRAG